jgi:hypothetical protein
VRTYLQNRPWVAVWCLTVESGVCLAGALGLFANLQRQPPPADEEQQFEDGAVIN